MKDAPEDPVGQADVSAAVLLFVLLRYNVFLLRRVQHVPQIPEHLLAWLVSLI